MVNSVVSVIIPVHNDPEGIVSTLDSLLAQETEYELDILVVDNKSTDDTPMVVSSYDNDRITLCHESNIQSSYAARNTGIEQTDADILAFMDANMTISVNWLDRALDTLESVDADYMGCNVELQLTEKPSIAARYDHHTGFPVEQYIDSQQFAPTCCLFVRLKVFEDIGPFDQRLVSGGDKEFGNRVYDAGYKLHFAKDVTMYHPTRNTLRELITKDLRVGQGLCQLQRYHPERYGRPGVPPRPSGIKSLGQELSMRDQLVFEGLSKCLTLVRGAGYYREYITGSIRRDIEGKYIHDKRPNSDE